MYISIPRAFLKSTYNIRHQSWERNNLHIVNSTFSDRARAVADFTSKREECFSQSKGQERAKQRPRSCRRRPRKAQRTKTTPRQTEDRNLVRSNVDSHVSEASAISGINGQERSGTDFTWDCDSTGPTTSSEVSWVILGITADAAVIWWMKPLLNLQTLGFLEKAFPATGNPIAASLDEF